MVNSVELIFDRDTEATLRRIWDDLRDAGIPSQAPASRPHVTLTVAERIDPGVDAALAVIADRFPMSCVIGAPLLFGRKQLIFTRLIVPTSELLAVHAEVYRLSVPHMQPGPMPNSAPGQWTAHTTLARRVHSERLGNAARIGGRPAEIKGSFAGLRRWDGKTKREYLI